MGGWKEGLETLSSEQRLMFEGGALSQFFLRWPLWTVHPTFVGAFYGLLIALATLLPTIHIGLSVHEMTIGETLRGWLYLSLQMILFTGMAGGASALISAFVKRPPISLEKRRKWIFPIPFIGLVLIATIPLAPELGVPPILAWLLLMTPGPAYVHLSYAPRWRILDRLDRGRTIDGAIRMDPRPMEIPSDPEVSAVVEEVSQEE